MRFATCLLLSALTLSAVFGQKNQPVPLWLDASFLRHELAPLIFQQPVFVEKMEPGELYILTFPSVEEFGGSFPTVKIAAGSMAKISPDSASGGWLIEPMVSKIGLIFSYDLAQPLPKNHGVSLRKPRKEVDAPAFSGPDVAVLTIQNNLPANTLVRDVLIGGDCFDVTNVTSVGNSTWIGKFTNGLTNIGFAEGMIMGSGNVATVAPGPNNSAGQSSGPNTVTPDADLTALAGGGTIYNKAVVEFDFKPTQANLSFDFVFASEEYCEWVGSQFNDRFGFFVSGPGITGPFSGNSVNIALVPMTATYVGINSVSHLTNTAYFHNNQPNAGANDCDPLPPNPATAAEVEYDGYTVPITAMMPVLIPCSTYHIKLKIGDLGDADWDSAVFMKAGSFGAGGKTSGIAVVDGNPADDTAVEGCDAALFRFFRVNGDTTQPLTITYTITGTATSGVDFVPIVTTITFPANVTSFDLPVTILTDALTEGQETIILTLSQPCSCNSKTITLKILDLLPLLVTIPPVTICGPGNATLTASPTGGQSPYTYLWDTGATTPSITVPVTTTTSFTVTVTDACGQTKTATQTVTVMPLPTATISGSITVCTNAAVPVTVPVTFTGTAPWTLVYTVNGVSTTITTSTNPYLISANVLTNITLVSVASPGNCVGTATGTYTVIHAPLSISGTTTNLLCNGANTGSILVTPSGGTPPVNYVWAPAQGNTNNPTGLPAGTFTVTATDANGCTATGSYTITQPPVLTATATPTTPADCLHPTGGGATASGGGGVSPYTFLWSDGQTGPNLTNVAPGPFTVTVTDANGCTKTATVTVAGNFAPPTAVAATSGNLTCTVLTVPLTGTGSSTGPNITYLWSGPNVTGSTTTINSTAGDPGTYTILVTNTTNGCTATAEVTVVENIDLPTAVASTPGSITCTTPTLVISGNGSSTGPPGFTYLWSANPGNIVSGGTTLNPTINQGGTYTITVTNSANNCTATATVTVDQDNTPPDAIIAPPPPLNCTATTIDIDATGSTYSPGATFNWSPTPAGGQGTLNPTVSGPGTFTLTITQSNGCTDVASVTVTQNITPPVAVAASPTPISCTNPTVDLLGNGSSTGPNITYEWSGPGITGPTTTINTTADAPGTYTILVTNSTNGCTALATTTIVGNTDLPTAVASTPGSITCTTPTLIISGNGSSTGPPGFTYLWGANPGNIVSGGTTLNPTINQGGTYTITVTNSSNNCTATATVDVVQDNTPPLVVIAPPPPLNCLNSTIEIDASGSTYSPGATFNWSPPGSIVSGGTTLNPTVNGPGTFTVTISQSNGCTAVGSVTVTQNITPPVAVAASPTPISCTNPTVDLLGNGSSTGPNITYLWSGPGITGPDNTINTTADAPGTYTILVTNSTNGCTALATTTIVGNTDLPTAIATTPGSITCTTPTLIISGNGSSTGPPGFTYLWGANPGNIVSGGTTLNPTINQGGTYTITVTNSSNNCTATAEVIVDQDNVPPVVVIAPPPPLDCNNSTIEIDASGSTYSPGATFNWSPPGSIVSGGTTLNPTVNGPGTFTVTISQSNGCTAVGSVTVVQNITPPTAVATSPTPLSCSNPNVNLFGNGSSTGPNITYLWSGPGITGPTDVINTTADLPGTYTILVTNTTNGCTALATTTVTGGLDLPIAVATTPGSITCTTPTLIISGNGSSTGPPGFTYLWSANPGNIVSGGTTLNPTINQGGTYTITVTNSSNNCTATAEVTVDQDNTPPDAIILPPAQLNCVVSAVEIDASGSLYQPGSTFQWSPTGGIIGGGNTLNPTVNQPGTYTLTITQSNGCTDVASVTVVLNNTLPVAIAASPTQISCANPNVNLLGNGSSTGPNITYQWEGPNVTGPTDVINTTAGAPGTYNLTVTNGANGCTAVATTVVVGTLDLPDAVATTPGSITCTTPTLIISGNGSSTGPPGFTYLWSANPGNIVSGGTTLNPTINQGGTYTITVTNTSNNCTATAVVDVDQDNVPPDAVILPPGQLNCLVVSLELDGGSGSTASPGATFNWSANPGNFLCCQNSTTPQINQPGTYSLTITQSNGCTDVAQITITQNITPPVANANASGSITCTTPEVTLLGTGSSTGPTIEYEWTTNFGQITGPTNTINSSAGLPGTYTLLVTNSANGCTAEDPVTVGGGIDYPDVAASVPGDLTCLVTTLTLSGNGSSVGPNFNYQWTASPGNIVSGANGLSPVVNQGGNYTLVVTNSTTQCTASITVEVVQNTVHPSVIIVPPGELNCIISSLELDASLSFYNPGATFLWTAAPGNFLFGQNTPTPTIDQPGNYSVTITNQDNGCTDAGQVVVILNNNNPVAVATASLPISCTNPEVPLSGAGSTVGPDIVYDWTSGNGQLTGPTNTINTTAGSSGTYQLMVLNTGNGCYDMDDATVIGNTDLPNAEALPSGELTCVTTQLALNGSGSSVGPNFNYLWSPPIPGSIVSGANSLAPIVNAPGVYTLVVTNSTNFCTAFTTVDVPQNIDYPTVIFLSPEKLNCNNAVVIIDATVSQVGQDPTFYWTTVPPGHIAGPSNEPTVIVDKAGVYSLKITNEENGCTDLASIQVFEDHILPVADAGPSGLLTCPEPLFIIDGTGSSSGPTIVYFWDTQNGNILTDPSQPQIQVDAAGIYTLVVVNNENGCTAEDLAIVTSNQVLPTAEAGPTGIVNCTNDVLNLNGAGSSAGSNFSYSWTTVGGNFLSGETTLTPAIDAGGVYVLLVTNNTNGCTALDDVQIAFDQTAPTAIATANGLITCTAPTMVLSGAGSSNGLIFSYLWETLDGNILSGSTGLNPTVNEAGNYSLIVTNSQNGCSTVATTPVNQDNSVPTATTVAPGLLDCKTDSVALVSTASSQGPNFSFVWQTVGGNFVSGQNSLAPVVNQPGSYLLTITNLTSNCSATATTVVEQNTTAPPADAGPPQTLTCVKLETEIGFTTPPNDPNLTFTWTTTGGNFVANQSTSNPTVNEPGTYNLLVFNSLNNCPATAQVVISENIVNPTALAAPGGTLTCTTTELNLNGAGSSTGNEFSYLWTTANGSILSGNTTLAPTVDAPGNYQLEIFNSINGCTSTTSTTVNEDAVLPTAAATSPGILTCAVKELTLSGSGSTTGQFIDYQWITVGGNILSGDKTLAPKVNEPGLYTLVVTNKNTGCTAEFSLNVDENITPPVAEAGQQATLNCLSPLMVLNGAGSSAGGGFGYLWTTANGNLQSGQTTLDPIIDKPGTYLLTVTDLVNGCTSTDYVEILKDVNEPTAAIAAPGTLDCDTHEIILNATGSSSGANMLLTWTAPTSTSFVSGQNGLSPTVQEPGNYILNITNLDNGCFDQTQVVVNQDIMAPPVDAGPVQLLTCVATQLQIGGPGNPAGSNYQFSWATVGGHFVGPKTVASPIVDAPGFYSITVTNTTNGCTAMDDVQVLQNIVAPVAEAGPGFTLDCQNPVFTMLATGSTGPTMTYLWTTVGGSFVGSNTILNAQIDAPGSYSLLVTDVANGCTDLSSNQILQSADIPLAIAGPPATLTCTILEAILNATGTSAGPEFSYKWTTPNGVIVSGNTTLNPTIAAPGTYKIEVTNDSTGCKSSSTVTVFVDVVPPGADAGPTVTLTCDKTTLNLFGSGSGSNSLSYFWTTTTGNIVSGETTASPVIGQPGVYNLLITNNLNGCTATDQVQVLADVNLPVIAIALPDTLTCAAISIVINAQNGTSIGSNISYKWTTTGGHFVSQNPILKPLVDQPGNYFLTVTNDDNGCSSTSSIEVEQNTTAPIADAGSSLTVTCVNPTALLDGSSSSAGPTFTFLWTTTDGNIVTGKTTAVPKIDKPGTYHLLITDLVNGCTATDLVIVVPDQTFPIAAVASPAVITCAAPLVFLNGNGSSAGPNFDLIWTTAGGNFTAGQTTLNPTVNEAGTYNLLITNNLNGCTATTSVLVTENTTPPTVDAGIGFELTCTVENGKLTGTASPQTSLKWTTSGGQILSGSNSLSPLVNEPGEYILTVTLLANGCTASDKVVVTEQTNVPTDLQTALTPPRCDGNVGKIIITAVAGGIGPYLYSINGGQSFFTDNDFAGIQPGTYTLLIEDSNGCEWSEPLTVPAPLEPAIFITPELKIDLGDNVQLQAQLDPAFPLSLVDTVIWSPMTGLTFTGNSIAELLSPFAMPFKNTVYKVTVISKAGCDASAKILLRVDDEPHIYIPNVISPWNQDQTNDQFLIFASPTQVVEIESFEMFDRWGDKVWAAYNFQPNRPADGWDAFVRGKRLNPAVFVYWARVKLIDGRVVLYKGDVTVVR